MMDAIVLFLRQRQEPASSHMLAERFLRTSVGSEEQATKLLRPLMEAAGARYIEGTGWIGSADDRAARSEERFVAAALDRESGQVVMAEPVVPDDLDRAVLVLLDPEREASLARAWLRERGWAQPASIVSLRSAIRGAARVPRHAGLDGFCAALGVRWLDGEDAEGIARAMAACIAVAVARRKNTPPIDAPPLPPGIAASTIAALPEAPGVYRFFDEDGALLYVGKAANLKRRVSSYFGMAAARRPRRFYPKIHRLEYEVAGSELEALLREARLIQSRRPSGNVQRSVHERGRVYGAARSWALLLPRADGRGVAAILVRDGRYLGHLIIGPRGGGLAGARKLIGRAVCGAAKRTRSKAPPDRNSEILSSWLSRNSASVSRVDLDSFGKATAAARALREAAGQVVREPTRVVVFR